MVICALGWARSCLHLSSSHKERTCPSTGCSMECIPAFGWIRAPAPTCIHIDLHYTNAHIHTYTHTHSQVHLQPHTNTHRGWAEILGIGKEKQGEVLLEMTYKVCLNNKPVRPEFTALSMRTWCTASSKHLHRMCVIQGHLATRTAQVSILLS